MWAWSDNWWISSLKVSYLACINFPGLFPKSVQSDKPSSTFFSSGMNYAYILCLAFEDLYMEKWTSLFLVLAGFSSGTFSGIYMYLYSTCKSMSWISKGTPTPLCCYLLEGIENPLLETKTHYTLHMERKRPEDKTKRYQHIDVKWWKAEA